MRTLILMRHGKSSFAAAGEKDRKRLLTKRGEKNAAQMAVVLKERELVPQIILCSSAVRARKTAEIVSNSLGFTGEIQYKDKLYMAEVEDILKVLNKLPDEIESAMVIGHNPGLETAIFTLTQKIEGLPTAGVAYISLSISHWKELGPDAAGELIELWKPKNVDALIGDSNCIG